MPTLAPRWLEEGKAEGIQIGIQKGIQRGIFETAVVMIRDFQTAINDVVVKLNIKKEELLEYIQKQNK